MTQESSENEYEADKAHMKAKIFSLDKGSDFEDSGVYADPKNKYYPGKKTHVFLKRLAVTFFIATGASVYFSHELAEDDDQDITWTDYVRDFVNKKRTAGNDILLLPTKGKYVGEFIHGQPHGDGKLIGEYGENYLGQWENGQFHGQGSLEYYDSLNRHAIYVGHFQNNKKHGSGLISWPSLHDSYEGTWENGIVVDSGHGSFTWEDGKRYEGEWLNNVPHGLGVLKIKDQFNKSSRYEGSFENGFKSGYGTFKWADGAQYSGQWKNDAPANSKIRIIWDNGQNYHGEWDIHAGHPHGQGTYQWPDGSIYSGMWRNGLEDGKGNYTYSDGVQYEGDWVNGEKNGTGIMTWPQSQHKYEGEFLNGYRHGQGTYYWSESGYYTGAWVQGKRTGKGLEVWSNGNQYNGEWLDSNKSGYGRFTYSSGSYYEGNWANDKPNGKGKFVSTNGQIYEGTWDNGCLKTWLGFGRNCEFGLD